MSESLEGLRVAATRQKAGRVKNCETAMAAPPGVGGVKVPAATVFADVIVVFGNLIETRLSQDAAKTGNAVKVKIASTAKHFRTFLAAIRLRPLHFTRMFDVTSDSSIVRFSLLW